jgi:hypothetical protein
MNYDGIKDMLCRELDDISHKELSSNNLDVIYKSVDVLKDIETIKAMENGYSNDYEHSNMYRPWYSYEGGSYDGRGRGTYANRDSQGRYANDGYSRSSAEEIRRLMDNAKDEHEREVLRKAMDSLNR